MSQSKAEKAFRFNEHLHTKVLTFTLLQRDKWGFELKEF